MLLCSTLERVRRNAERDELAPGVDQRAAAVRVPRGDHATDDKGVVAYRQMTGGRDHHPGEYSVKYWQAERVTMPAGPGAEPRRSRLAEAACQVGLVIGQQMHHDVTRGLHGRPRRAAQSHGEGQDRRVERDGRERRRAEPDRGLHARSDDRNSLCVVTHGGAERRHPGRIRAVSQPAIDCDLRNRPLRSTIDIAERLTGERLHVTFSGISAGYSWANSPCPFCRSAARRRISSAYGEVPPDPYAARCACQSARAPSVSPSAYRLAPRRYSRSGASPLNAPTARSRSAIARPCSPRSARAMARFARKAGSSPRAMARSRSLTASVRLPAANNSTARFAQAAANPGSLASAAA